MKLERKILVFILAIFCQFSSFLLFSEKTSAADSIIAKGTSVTSEPQAPTATPTASPNQFDTPTPAVATTIPTNLNTPVPESLFPASTATEVPVATPIASGSISSNINTNQQVLVNFESGESVPDAVGSVFYDITKTVQYKITNNSSSKRTVTLVKVMDTSVTEISVPEIAFVNEKNYKITKIGKAAFSGCRKLKKVTLSSDIDSIGEKAFSQCSKLQRVWIDSTKLKSIGKKAFYGCTKLGSVVIMSKKLKSVGKGSFDKTGSNLKFSLPKSKAEKYMKLIENSSAAQTVTKTSKSAKKTEKTKKKKASKKSTEIKVKKDGWYFITVDEAKKQFQLTGNKVIMKNGATYDNHEYEKYIKGKLVFKMASKVVYKLSKHNLSGKLKFKICTKKFFLGNYKKDNSVLAVKVSNGKVVEVASGIGWMAGVGIVS